MSEPAKTPASFEKEQNEYLQKLVRDAYDVYIRLKALNEETLANVVSTIKRAEKALAGSSGGTP